MPLAETRQSASLQKIMDYLRHDQPLNLPCRGGRVFVLSRSPTFLFLAGNLRLQAVVCVQLKAVVGNLPLYVVF